MKTSGLQLKEMVRAGIESHESRLTLSLQKSLHDTIDTIDDGGQYDLFCVIMEILLRQDCGQGRLVAQLMKASRPHYEAFDPHFVADLGYLFEEQLQRSVGLDYFSKVRRLESSLGLRARPSQQKKFVRSKRVSILESSQLSPQLYFDMVIQESP